MCIEGNFTLAQVACTASTGAVVNMDTGTVSAVGLGIFPREMTALK